VGKAHDIVGGGAGTLPVTGLAVGAVVVTTGAADEDEDAAVDAGAELTDEEARETAEDIWASINEPNLLYNVLTTRGRATLVLSKGEDHSVQRIRLRKL